MIADQVMFFIVIPGLTLALGIGLGIACMCGRMR
jgi:hypothetical protein